MSEGLKKYIAYLKFSYQHWTGRELPEDLTHINSVIASHSSIPNIIEKLAENNINDEVFDLSQKPVFIFANNAACKLWDLSLDQFIGSPSSNTAENQEQSERDRLLLEVEKSGYVNDYSGIRVTSSGKRFAIEQALVWKVFIGNPSQKIGQAVEFDKWYFLD